MLLSNCQRKIRKYKLLIKAHPRKSINYIRLGNIYNGLTLSHLAIQYFKKALSLSKKNSNCYFDLGMSEASIGHMKSCIQNVERSILFAPHSHKNVLYDALGHIYQKQGGKHNTWQALKCFKKAIDLYKDESNYYYHAGIAELALRDYDASIHYMKLAISKSYDSKFNQKCMDAYNHTGVRCSEAKKLNSAKKWYKAALIFGRSAVVYYNLAQAEIGLGDTSKAISDAKKGLTIDPNNKKCYSIINYLQGESYTNSTHQLEYDPNVNYIEKLDNLVGLKSVERQIKQYVNRAVIHKVRTGHHGHGEIHLILEGNPGTGKTTVAKLLCGILYQEHITSKKNFIAVNATQLIGWRYGESAKNLRKVINIAKGGVLFIDEAYHLAHRTDGNSVCQDELVAELLPDVEKYRNNLVVIMAGYTHKMEHFLKHANPGLGSRFPDRIKFPDYNNQECKQILHLQLNDHHFHLASASTERLLDKDTVGFIDANRYDTSHVFANARTVRNLYVKLIDSFSNRLMNQYTRSQLNNFKAKGDELINTIETTDVKNTFKKYNSYKDSRNAVRALNNLIGLKRVKTLIKTYINQVAVHKIRTGRNDHDGMNIVFEGNPGTGKTTVAKLFCEILYQRGIVKSPRYVHLTATYLQNKYTGQSAKNLRLAFEKAKNGVLFIDEAYALGDMSNPVNESIVEQLVSSISRYKNKIVVILSGYPKAMEKFLNYSNAGLSSRFSDRVKFPDYTNNECVDILKYDLKQDNLKISSAKARRLLSKDLKEYLSVIRHNNKSHEEFANARTVNNFFKYLKRNFYNRICEYPISRLRDWKRHNSKYLNIINISDVRKTNEQMKHLAYSREEPSIYSKTSMGFKTRGKD